MKCPVCNKINDCGIDLHADGFYEDLFECSVCGATWSVSHGDVKVISDPQAESFLQGETESVEGDDYNQMR